MIEDKKRVELLLHKFTPKTLRLTVYFLSFDSTVSAYRKYLEEHKDFHPEFREILRVLHTLSGIEVNELLTLSRNIVINEYPIDEIIPLN